jgi:hypothetical protein
MKAALQIVLLLFTMFRLQRWLGALGIVGLVAAYFVSPPAALGLLIYGLVLLLLAPALGGGLLMRSLSSPRTLLLVPFGRLQILAGMLLSTLFVAGCVTLLVSSLPLDRLVQISPALVFARVEAIATVLLLGSFICAHSVPAATMWVFAIALIPLLLQSDRHTFLPLMRLDAGTVALFCLVLWVAFTAAYLRTRLIRPPDDGSGTAPVPVTRVKASRRSAVRAYLTGSPSMSTVVLGGLIGTFLICGMWFLMFLLVPSGESVSVRLSKAIAPALWFLAFAGIGGFIVSRRSKTLWLRSGLGRRELLRLCEAQAWRYFVESSAPMLILLVAAWVIEPSSGRWLTLFFPFQLAIGACILYLGLMHVQGWRLPDLALAFMLAVFWIIAMAVAQSPSSSPLFLPGATVAAVVLAFVLRIAGLRRWSCIDWVICRPPRSPSRVLHAGS